jgi:hypothetical protein
MAIAVAVAAVLASLFATSVVFVFTTGQVGYPY